MPNYGTKKYWDKRYREQKNSVFEWLENYIELKDIINKYCGKDEVVLNLGCGNSIIQEDMYDDGYNNIYNIDISEECILQMEQRKEDRKGLIYQVMDCTHLEYKDEMFDFVIDKSTIDALLCGDYSYLNVAKMMSEVQRVLKPGGVYLIISYGEPYNRTFHFERDHLDFSCTSFALPAKDAQDGSGNKQNPHYVYILKKGPLANKNHHDNYEKVIKELIKEEEEAILKYGSQNDSEEEEQQSNNKHEEESQDISDEKYSKQELSTKVVIDNTIEGNEQRDCSKGEDKDGCSKNEEKLSELKIN